MTCQWNKGRRLVPSKIRGLEEGPHRARTWTLECLLLDLFETLSTGFPKKTTYEQVFQARGDRSSTELESQMKWDWGRNSAQPEKSQGIRSG